MTGSCSRQRWLSVEAASSQTSPEQKGGADHAAQLLPSQGQHQCSTADCRTWLLCLVTDGGRAAGVCLLSGRGIDCLGVGRRSSAEQSPGLLASGCVLIAWPPLCKQLQRGCRSRPSRQLWCVGAQRVSTVLCGEVCRQLYCRHSAWASRALAAHQ